MLTCKLAFNKAISKCFSLKVLLAILGKDSCSLNLFQTQVLKYWHLGFGVKLVVSAHTEPEQTVTANHFWSVDSICRMLRFVLQANTNTNSWYQSNHHYSTHNFCLKKENPIQCCRFDFEIKSRVLFEIKKKPSDETRLRFKTTLESTSPDS